MSSTLVLIFVLVGTLVHFFIKHCRKPQGFPNGPPRLPIIGSLPYLSGRGIESFLGDSVTKYGDIVGLYAGEYPLVVINSWAIAKRLMAMDVTTGRLQNYTTSWARSTGGEALGIITTDGERWNTQRTFALKQLKNFGLSKKHLDSCILPQAKEVVQYLEEQGEIVQMDGTVFSIPVLNVIWNMMTGVSLERLDLETKRILDGLNYLFASKLFIVSSIFPWIRFFLPSLTGYNLRLKVLRSAQDMLRRIIREHEETLNKNEPRDLIDAYITEGRASKNPEFSTEQLIMVCFDLMAAGAETTSTTLLWIVEYLVLYPEVQEKCFQEIQKELGSAEVSLANTEGLHYCLATIAEVQRLAAVAPALINHRLTQQVELEGYILPKDCLVTTNLKHFMTDPSLWKNPDSFDPSRFLDEKGEFFKPEQFVPLGHGKRVCMGESLAKAELAVFFVALVQNLKFSVVAGREPTPDNYVSNFTRIALPFPVRIQKR